MNVDERARIHAALGDRHRLAMVDALRLGDRTFQELADGVGLRGNLAAHHLDVLEAAGLIERRVSEGDHRRRYISVRWDRLDSLLRSPVPRPELVVFVCTHNSARSQFAAARWHQLTGLPAQSAGSDPAPAVHPQAARIAHEFDLDLEGAVPKGYGAIEGSPGLVVSVCDRARETGLPADWPSTHWSIPDPVLDGRPGAFRSAFALLSDRIERLAGPVA